MYEVVDLRQSAFYVQYFVLISIESMVVNKEKFNKQIKKCTQPLIQLDISMDNIQHRFYKWVKQEI